MYLPKSADIARRHPEATHAIEAIDQIIYNIGAYPLRPTHVADSLELLHPVVERILHLYVEAGVLQKEVRLVCPVCEFFLENDGTDSDWCDNCETTFARRRPVRETVFAPVNPISRRAVNDESTVDVVTPISIRFIAGDRGGAQRNQLQIPKEYNQIKAAVNSAKYRTRVRIETPLLAASAQDISFVYQSNPTILHFGGHGDERELSVIVDKTLVASTEPLSADQLLAMLQSFPTRVRVCVFNTCKSLGIASQMSKNGAVDVAIGWDGDVGDATAILFAASLYAHIANGLSVAQAFELATAALPASVPSVKPTLCCAAGVQAKDLFLLCNQ